MSVKKLSFYLDSARITVCSDHLPLKRFLEKNTLNAKVNNWAVELESQKIDFVFIQGTKNVLADTLSRLIEIDDDIKLPAEQEGHEFGYVPFEQLPPAQVTVTEEVIINEINNLKIKIQHIDPVQKILKNRTTHFKSEIERTPGTGQENQPPQKTVVRKQTQQEHLCYGE